MVSASKMLFWLQVVNREHVRMKVWERGAGPTLACGTGACPLPICTLSTYVSGGFVSFVGRTPSPSRPVVDDNPDCCFRILRQWSVALLFGSVRRCPPSTRGSGPRRLTGTVGSDRCMRSGSGGHTGGPARSEPPLPCRPPRRAFDHRVAGERGPRGSRAHDGARRAGVRGQRESEVTGQLVHDHPPSSVHSGWQQRGLTIARASSCHDRQHHRRLHYPEVSNQSPGYLGQVRTG